MGKNGHPELLLLLLFNAAVQMETRLLLTIYLFSKELTWTDARQFCQTNHIDMITWDIVDPNLLTTWLQNQELTEIWIGLHEDPEQLSVWRWINVKTGEGLTGEDVSGSSYWDTQPKTDYSCGSYNSAKKKWFGNICSETLPFVCYDDNLVLLTENKTWEEAMGRCREMSSASYKYDLLSVTRPTDFSYVRDRIYRATSEEVWTGLRFLGGEWWWSDGETLDHQEMLPDCPSQWQHCGMLSKYNTANWISGDCSERRNFICNYVKLQEDHD
ncbi:macrophage mannose receptor 1-like [Poecilia latipinna]|uniref:macrophage mannose receptor 1-like n=1 Tax=Poecilia latipinna TaxID=48699 RepID=UPI00072DE80E|nr:PREDICTED: macrophage mannose receptor 1-like [Poecilia latipinna]